MMNMVVILLIGNVLSYNQSNHYNDYMMTRVNAISGQYENNLVYCNIYNLRIIYIQPPPLPTTTTTTTKITTTSYQISHS